MSSYNKLSQLQYNLCKEASNIPSPSLHLSGILLRQGFETERKDLYSLSRCFYCYFREIDADHGEYHCQNYLCYVFVLVSCWKTMKSYDNILCYFWQCNYASATFIPHVFLLVATYIIRWLSPIKMSSAGLTALLCCYIVHLECISWK